VSFFLLYTIGIFLTINLMIRIEQDTTVNLRLTIGERSLLDDPSYLIRFVYDEERPDVWFFTPDVSEWPRRYNQFNVIIGTQSGPTFSLGDIDVIIPDFGSGQTDSVSLRLLPGWGDYLVYEVTQDNPPIFSGDILEVGRFRVDGPVTPFYDPLNIYS
jgi:hypothetical protein